jgi:hypothetical protein
MRAQPIISSVKVDGAVEEPQVELDYDEPIGYEGSDNNVKDAAKLDAKVSRPSARRIVPRVRSTGESMLAPLIFVDRRRTGCTSCNRYINRRWIGA